MVRLFVLTCLLMVSLTASVASAAHGDGPEAQPSGGHAKSKASGGFFLPYDFAAYQKAIDAADRDRLVGLVESLCQKKIERPEMARHQRRLKTLNLLFLVLQERRLVAEIA